MEETVNYDEISKVYGGLRVPDPRIASIILEAVRTPGNLVNIGAGLGSYEPKNCDVVAVDRSFGMLAGRRKKGRVVQAIAENLPFASNSFDVALGILTIHHWGDWKVGLREALRVAKSRVVLLTWFCFPDGFWLMDYIPEIATMDSHLFPSAQDLSAVLGSIQISEVPIPRDCTDGMLCAYWARPERYLEPEVRKAISGFARIAEPTAGLAKLESDLKSGVWQEKYGRNLLDDSKDYGYRLVIAEKTDT